VNVNAQSIARRRDLHRCCLCRQPASVRCRAYRVVFPASGLGGYCGARTYRLRGV